MEHGRVAPAESLPALIDELDVQSSTERAQGGEEPNRTGSTTNSFVAFSRVISTLSRARTGPRGRVR